MSLCFHRKGREGRKGNNSDFILYLLCNIHCSIFRVMIWYLLGLMSQPSENREQGLKRQLSAGQMAMVAVGGSIGTGLLLGSGAAIQVAGPAVIISYLISALIAWTVAMAMGELSAMHPAAGS